MQSVSSPMVSFLGYASVTLSLNLHSVNHLVVGLAQKPPHLDSAGPEFDEFLTPRSLYVDCA